ncbi:unnamed protein product [Clonostachys byssicola]|uniref:Uncharacterized protein n=1 Tax=Clonostachys byssicola TaxID=160290 RepID=A0A9N9UUC2_9HYPO|nr:unnamed protein product [Clonostachys byssicola]
MRHSWLYSVCIGLFFLVSSAFSRDDLGIGNGTFDLTIANFDLSIARDAQVLVSLRPSGDSFDFLPFDKLQDRAFNGQYHWGDLTYRYRVQGEANWVDGDTAQNRKALTESKHANDVLKASGLSPTLPNGPLQIIREWMDVDGDLGLRFTVRNTGESSVEIGSLGFPATFNNIFTGRTPEDAQKLCSLSQPYIGMDAGQIRVTPIRGDGTTLVVTPLINTTSSFEAYRFLSEPYFDSTRYQTHEYEGNYEWQVLTKAWAEKEWADQDPWNSPSSMIIKAGEEARFGLRFSLSLQGVRGFDKAVRKTGMPVAKSVPGYILPRDLPGKLFIQSDSEIVSIIADPENALSVTRDGLHEYSITPSDSAWGRARVQLEYRDGKTQTIHYYIVKATVDAISDMGSFLTKNALFNDSSDPFLRSPSIMNYDHEEGHILDQEPRVYLSGLSDEAGTGAYLAAFMKQIIQPNMAELEVLNAFVDEVMSTNLQREDNAIRKSLFFYEPDKLPQYKYEEADWSQWGSWNKEASYLVDRAYNYVHPAAAYWALYRVSRSYSDVTTHDWDWYLKRAHQTIMRSIKNDVLYNDLGLMGETVWGEILLDLQREGLDIEARELEEAMRNRSSHWNAVSYPYGSEAPWDSTGQEGVYYWAKYFGLSTLTEKTVNSVLGFMPSIPHWAWHGNAHRYWDFSIAAKIKTFERQVHHYASALNAQVLLSAFRDDPSDTYLLDIGHGGSFAPLSNIHQDGFPSAAFHSFPELLTWDSYLSDYGQGFLGLSLAAGTYIAEDQDIGLVAYGGILNRAQGTVSVEPRDPSRKRIFIGPLKTMITIETGIIEKLVYDESGRSISFTISQLPDAPSAKDTIMRIDFVSGSNWELRDTSTEKARGGWKVPLLKSESVQVELYRE